MSTTELQAAMNSPQAFPKSLLALLNQPNSKELMTDIERVELAVRRTSAKIKGHTQEALRIWLLELASELARVHREAK